MTATTLGNQMRALADNGHARASELRLSAAKFDEATNGLNAEPPTHTVKQMLGCWARARRIWCDCTGEDLI